MIRDPHVDTNPRLGGVWRKPGSEKPRMALKYCLGKDCNLMSAGHLNYWLPCDAQHAEQKGYMTIMAFCPAHQVLPSDKLVSA